MERSSGVLFPVSALPSRYGIGDFGSKAKEFVDIISSMGFKTWQILPLNPLGYGHSPYQPFSSFALDELYIDLEDLVSKGLIEEPSSFNEDSSKVLYEDIRTFKTPILRKAFKAYMKKEPHGLDEFIKNEPWVKNWSIFMGLKRSEALHSWNEWPLNKQNALSRPLSSFTKQEKDDFNYEIFLQKFLYEEWFGIKSYASSKGISIIGDLPFYVGFDSCDVYEDQADFLLDPISKEPAWIAGVPPDYFSKTGQRWGNPIYNWDLLKKNKYSFVINRIRGNSRLYDIIRLDHFRAFDTYWKIPASCETAIEGSWILGPSYDFFDTLLHVFPDVHLIAEDLGDLRPEVLTLRDHYDFPGMNVIEFTFHDAAILHKPGYDKENMVAYLGTHDNDTMKGYFEKLPDDEKSLWIKALEDMGLTTGNINERMVEYELSLPAKFAIFSLQDILALGSEARLNVPGIIDDNNWTWRLTNFDSFLAKKDWISGLIRKYNR